METWILGAITFFVALDYGINTFVDFLNNKSSKKPLDSELSELYDEKEHRRSVDYQAANYKVSFISSTLFFVLLILALTYEWFAALDSFVREQWSNEIVISLAFIGILTLLSNLISLPFGIYSTFKVEAKYGFNKSTVATFVSDLIKGLVLTLVIGGALLTAVLWIYQELRSTFWLWAWLLFAGFSLFFCMFGTKLILPLFNKLTPVPDGELRTEVERYCASQGYSLGSNLQTFVLFALLGWLLGVEELSTALGASESSFHLSALAFFLLFSPVSMLLGLLNNGISRRNEYQADDFARETYDEGGAFLREALKKISTDALANLSPHPLYVAVNYTHPPIRERLRNLA